MSYRWYKCEPLAEPRELSSSRKRTLNTITHQIIFSKAFIISPKSSEDYVMKLNQDQQGIVIIRARNKLLPVYCGHICGRLDTNLRNITNQLRIIMRILWEKIDDDDSMKMVMTTWKIFSKYGDTHLNMVMEHTTKMRSLAARANINPWKVLPPENQKEND